MRELQSGQAIGQHYTLGRQIGKGGSSSVYEAYDARFDRQVAIKIFKSSYVAENCGADRLRREFRVMGRMRAPFLPIYLDVGEFDGLPWLAMELITGESFRSKIRLGTLDWASTIRILGSVAEALDFLHNNNESVKSQRDPIVHRDVKPGNIICPVNYPYTSAVLVDFGISKAISDSQITEHGFVVGTGGYFAPEAYQRGRDERGVESDRWSLAAVAWESLTGINPGSKSVLQFPMGLAGRTSQELSRLAQRSKSKIPAEALSVLERGLALNPQARHESCIGFVRDLDRALFGKETSLIDPGEDDDSPTPGEHDFDVTRVLTEIVGPDGNPFRPVYLQTEMIDQRSPVEPGNSQTSADNQIERRRPRAHHPRGVDKEAPAHQRDSREGRDRAGGTASSGTAGELGGEDSANDRNGVYLVDANPEAPRQVPSLSRRLRRLAAKYREEGYLE